MHVDASFWVWLVLAAILFIAEILTAGFFMLPFAVGAVSAAALEYLGLGLGWQWLSFIGVSIVLLVGLRRFAEHVTGPSPELTGIDRLLDARGIVIEDIEPHSGQGRVRVGAEEWRAFTPDHEALRTGTRVVVKRVEGTRVVVIPSEGPARPAEGADAVS